MRLWIGLHLPRLPLEVFCPSWSADTCSAVLDHDAVLAVSDQARRAGVVPGMRRGGALMMAPEAQLHERAPDRETEALHAVAMAMLQFTPQVAEGEEATLLMDVGASLRLFGGIRRLCALVRASLRKLGFTGLLAVAPTARGAWLLARGGAGRAIRLEKMTALLHRLPASLLPPARPYMAWLEGIGCLSVGDVARLPRPGLQRRCGRALLDVLDAALGHAAEMFHWIEAPATFHAKLELFGRIENTDLLLAGACRLLQQMTGWLNARQLAVERITLLLEHERGKVARPPTPVEIVLAEAVWRDDHLVRLLKERLAKLALEAPVIGLVLEAPQLKPMAPLSDSLFPEPGGSQEDRQRLFELLVARLGADNVLQAAPKADYRPEHANAWVPVQQKVRPQDVAACLPPGGLPRPAWLLPKPIALLVRDHRPFYCSPLRMVSAAERIEAGWWSDTQTRDYFIAQGEDNAHYWVYRERLPGGEEEAEPRWYLHGLFG
ncbi:Y-family DNA polymerase [Pseudoduganella umbonata]|uniref:DNA polymerase Y family protein n=1 Tax=Pseudoduganella umbonata TaxID=864828 RepID=A0A4P8HQD1_9BURK|nr:DNA polymerase Y family protein [Pseudoduganella umbonata]MBB3224262.1 protein ImuB [Pseudoduganella umbonata]QCP11356.1 DNA polymerase Y family protein [Pseudoduganella umbonata]